MKTEDLNPWWKTSHVEQEILKLEKRELFNEIQQYLKEKQIIAITGLRRTGKTVLLHHLIEELLKQNPPEKILYYNFDLFDDAIETILNQYSELLNIDLKKDKIFIFLDEVQKHKNWENEIKIIYDHWPNIKFFISGSSSLFIEKKTKESLAGRVFSFTLQPLTFQEYLKLKKTGIDKKKINLYQNEFKRALKHYLKTGGFPELLETTEDIKINKYIKEAVLDKVIYMDIPSIFEIEETELLTKILSIISASPGMLLEYDKLANDLKRNRKTISNYIFYLEKAFLIKKVYNYSKNQLTSEKKLKKFYPFSTTLAYLFNAEEGKIIETAVLMNHEFKFFSRDGNREVDFIAIENKKAIPFEIKYQEQIKNEETRGLRRFMEKEHIQEGFMITKDYSAEKKEDNYTIRFIPLWKWLLEL